MTSMIRWRPFRRDLVNWMDRFFEEANQLSNFGDWGEALINVALDAYETDDAIVIEASLPGLSQDDVEITLDGDVLRLSGEFKQREEREGVRYLLNERCYGKFQRLLRLNVPVDADKAEAVFEDGQLRLTLPKAEAAKPKVIAVKKSKTVTG